MSPSCRLFAWKIFCRSEPIGIGNCSNGISFFDGVVKIALCLGWHLGGCGERNRRSAQIELVESCAAASTSTAAGTRRVVLDVVPVELAIFQETIDGNRGIRRCIQRQVRGGIFDHIFSAAIIGGQKDAIAFLSQASGEIGFGCVGHFPGIDVELADPIFGDELTGGLDVACRVGAFQSSWYCR